MKYLAMVIVHAEAFGADGTLVNQLPFNVSDQLAQPVQFSFELSNCR